MKKKSASIVLFFVGLVCLLTVNTFSQQKTLIEGGQSQKEAVRKRILQNYIEVSSITRNNGKAFFNKVTPEERSELFRFHLALQIIKRPALNREQKDLILDTLSVLSADSYDKSKDRIKTETQAQVAETLAETLFTRDEAYKIFESLGGGGEDVAMLQKYQNIISLRSINQRKKLFNQITPKDRSNLWKVHLAYHLTANENLNKPQKDFILKVIDFLNPSVYQITKGVSRRKNDNQIQEIADEAVTLFTKEEQTEILYGFGDGEIDEIETGQDCTCRKTSSGECSASATCAGGGCGETWFGCGAAYAQS